MIHLKYGCLALILILVSAGCGQEEPAPPPPVVVRTQTITFDAQSAAYVYSGSVRGRYESRLGFQVGGKIIARRVDLGSTVKAGDTLMEIDPKDLEESQRMARAQMDAAKSKLSLAEVDFQRYDRLFQDGAASKSQYDQYKTAFDSASDSYKQATAQYNQSSNALEYSRLTAEADGIISELTAEVGQVVSSGQPVATLVRTGALEIEITVPENKIAEVRLEQPAAVSLWALPGVTLSGQVREISPMADSTTRTYAARVSLNAPPPEVQLGMTASVRLTPETSARRAALAPLSAIYQTGGRPQVWLVKDNQVSLKAVTVEDFDENQVLITEGLGEGDVIVTAGVHKLHEGQTVRLMADNN